MRDNHNSKNKKIVFFLICMLISSSVFSITGVANQPPKIPNIPNGPNEVITEETHNYTTYTTDPDGDQMQYGWDWDEDYIVDD